MAHARFKLPYNNYAITRKYDVYSSAIDNPKDRIEPNRPGKGALLNHCSMPYVRRSVHEAIMEAQSRWSGAHVEERQQRADEVREIAAKAIGAPDPRGVVFAENVTTVNSLTAALGGALDNPELKVVVSNAENPSTVMAVQWIGDHSNQFNAMGVPATFDPWRSFKRLQSRAIPVTLLERYVNAFGQMPGTINEQIARQVPSSGSCIAEFSHVMKQTGRILPVQDMTRAAKETNSNTFVIVDGAQAFTNVPRVDVGGIGCDAYLFPGHKGVGSRPLGISYISNIDDPAIAARVQSVAADTAGVLRIHPETFHKDLRVSSNTEGNEFPLENVIGFEAAMARLQSMGLLNGDDDFSEYDNKRAGLRTFCKQSLAAARSDIEFVEDGGRLQSNGILAFRMRDNPEARLGDNEIGAEHLNPNANLVHVLEEMFKFWHIKDIKWEHAFVKMMAQRGIEMSFLAPRKLFRVSFSELTTKDEITYFVQSLTELMEHFDRWLDGNQPMSYAWRMMFRGADLWDNHIRRLLLRGVGGWPD